MYKQFNINTWTNLSDNINQEANKSVVKKIL